MNGSALSRVFLGDSRSVGVFFWVVISFLGWLWIIFGYFLNGTKLF